MTDGEVVIPGVVGRITISAPGLFRGAQILVDGAPAKKGGWGKVLLQRADGSTVEAKLADHLTRTVPSIQIGADKYSAGVPIPIVQIVLMFLPFGLVTVGGALGGLCGGVGFVANQLIVRSNRPAGLKAALMLGVTGAAVLAFLGLATVFYTAVH